ncbi:MULTISPECIES: S9 family peptidase [Idiomarina]|nr:MULTISPECIES: S9 family peptidase [Idiomarina]KPD21169.1 peptidase S9 [Idiomarina abyssalis]MAO68541.1 S9 family peptidase [Idiomarina sp.]MBF79205.1 S9 family peptidase [Idiomarina sp.]MBP59874.1 S9 family peptidase [Idiomarina sp.]SFT73694.1 dipeptidyl-peptidase-4 [Idiomarina abyssalis]|tara:strand:- start:5942 stop:8242 length:2301 start_codon:yes stop_codon:yes gene_type:complete
MSDTSFRSLRLMAAVTAIITLSACSNLGGTQPDDESKPAEVTGTSQLTPEKIFASDTFSIDRPAPTRWLEDGSGYTTLEQSDSADGRDIVRYHPETNERTVLVSAEQLTPQGRDKALHIADYVWSDDGDKVLIFTNTKRSWRTHTLGDYWVLDRSNNELRKLGGNAPESTLQFAKFNPQGTKVAYVMQNNIYVQNLRSFTINALTSDGNETIVNGTFDWVNEEEFFLRDGFRWSPNGKHIAYWQLDTEGTPVFTMINNTDELYPTLKEFPYPKVGETNAAMRIGVMPASGGKTQWMDIPGDPRQHYLVRMNWAGNSEQLLIQQLTRKQHINRAFISDIETGRSQELLRENTDSWAEYVDDIHFLNDGREFTWLSERSGYRHIYRVQRDSGRTTAVTRGNWDVVEVLRVNEDNGWVYFIASPETPLERYLFRASLDGSGRLERLTPDMEGTHSYSISQDAKYAEHTFHSVNQVPVTKMISLPDHKVIRTVVDNTDAQKAVENVEKQPVEFFRVEARDGLELDGYIMKPTDFDSSKEYPILFYVYGEPWGQTVANKWGGSLYLWHTMLTQQGYIVASIDNRGTKSPRGFDWRRSIYKNLGVVTVRDQYDALQQMLERWDFIDESRVGIWGHSGGGSQTLNALFRYPDAYNMGMALAPVPDLTLYDTIYQERYSGLLPESAERYKETSAITHAENLEGDLLLVHGTGDDNVHFQGSERLVNELIKHGKQFEFFAYPNRSHGIYEGEGTTLHLRTMMTEFVKENLPAGGR